MAQSRDAACHLALISTARRACVDEAVGRKIGLTRPVQVKFEETRVKTHGKVFFRRES